MEKDTLNRLFEKYYNQTKLYTYTLCRNMTVAEDIVSEAFYKALATVDYESESFKYWLLRVCRNKYFDYLKKQKKLKPIEDDNEIVSDDNVIDKIIKEEKYAALYKAINILDENYREAIVLFYFEELKIKEIALIMGRSEENIKVLLFRARGKLKDILEA